MFKVKQFVVNPLQENCYVVSDETEEAVIIDCGCFSSKEWEDIKNYILAGNLKIVHLINTHAHFDHILGEGFVCRDFKVSPEGSEEDGALYDDLDGQLRMFMLPTDMGVPPLPKMKGYLAENDIVSFGNHKFQVIHTPGHTRGGLSFYCKEENVLFTGDTLFCSSIGRTDFPGGSYEQIISAITKKILTLPPDTLVYSGHGIQTTVRNEMENNPYL